MEETIEDLGFTAFHTKPLEVDNEVDNAEQIFPDLSIPGVKITDLKIDKVATDSYKSGTDLDKGIYVYLGSDGVVYPAGSVVGYDKVLGVTDSSASSGNNGDILISGISEAFSGLTVGSAYYLVEGTTNTTHSTTTSIDAQSIQNTSQRYASVFNSGDSEIIDFFKFSFTTTGSPASGNFILEIYAVDASYKPTGSALVTGTISTNIDTTYEYLTFPLGYKLDKNTDYAAVVYTDVATLDASNYYQIAEDRGGSIVNKAWYSSDSGSTWASLTTIHADFISFNFREGYSDGTVSTTQGSEQHQTYTKVGLALTDTKMKITI